MRFRGIAERQPWLRTYVCAVVAHPWRVLLLVGLTTVALSLRVGTLSVHIDTDANLPQEHPYVQADTRIRQLFAGRNVLAITVVPAAGTIWNRETLATVAAITQETLRLPGIISANVLSLASSKVKDIRGTADGIETRRLMAAPPEDEAAIRAIAAAVTRNEIYVGSIVSERGDAAAIYLDFREDLDDEEIFLAVRAVVDAARRRSADTIYLTGGPAYVHAFAVATRDTVWLFGVALVVIMGILYLAFRSLQGTLLPTATALLSTLWGLGIMAWAGTTMDGWNSIAPILTVAVAAGHSVQILKRFYEEYERLGEVRAAVVESTVKIGVVMLTAGFIAAASFASLVTFGIASIRVFGVFTAVGIACALVLEMTFIPACRSLLPAPRRRAERFRLLDRLLAAMARLVVRAPARRTLIAAAGLLVVTAAWRAARSWSTTRCARSCPPTTRRASVRTRSSATSAAACRSTSSSRATRKARSRIRRRSR